MRKERLHRGNQGHHHHADRGPSCDGEHFCVFSLQTYCSRNTRCFLPQSTPPALWKAKSKSVKRALKPLEYIYTMASPPGEQPESRNRMHVLLEPTVHLAFQYFFDPFAERSCRICTRRYCMKTYGLLIKRGSCATGPLFTASHSLKPGALVTIVMTHQFGVICIA